MTGITLLKIRDFHHPPKGHCHKLFILWDKYTRIYNYEGYVLGIWDFNVKVDGILKIFVNFEYWCGMYSKSILTHITQIFLLTVSFILINGLRTVSFYVPINQFFLRNVTDMHYTS